MLSRRRFLVAAGTGAAGLAAGAGAASFFERADDPAGDATVPFYGPYQAGIATAAQDRLVFASFDLTLSTRAELRDLLRQWTASAALMTGGEPTGAVEGHPAVPPADTGEALGLSPAKLTVTFGLGPSLFARDALGLAARRPSALHPIGHLPGDLLDPARSDGDLCVQACANDPQVAFHAVRNLARIGRGAVVLRWTQLGFGRTSSTTSTQETARNLQGFKDGTNNLHGDDAKAMSRFVWVGDDEPQRWFRGGTYLVARRIRMLIETWDRTSLGDQEATIGRSKVTGAPLTGNREHDRVDLDLRGTRGHPGDSPRRPRPAGGPCEQQRRANPPPRLFLHRRHRSRKRRARCGPVLHLLPTRPAQTVRGDPRPARSKRRAQRVHQAHGQRPLRRPARHATGRIHRRGPLHLTRTSRAMPSMEFGIFGVGDLNAAPQAIAGGSIVIHK